jgi:class 3 adenylate cyclase
MVRVVRCFAFVEVCGLIPHMERFGDQDGVDVLAALRARLRRAAESHGIRLTKWLGDGALLSGSEGMRVVDCVVDVAQWAQEQGVLPIRAGLAEGPVIMFEGDDYVGAAVNLAARLGASAQPGQILIDGVLGARMWTRHPARALAPLHLQGFAEPVLVSEVLIEQTPA